MSEIKTVKGIIKGYNSIEVEGEIFRAIPMNYIQVQTFFGCICYIQLQKVEGGYIILEIIKEEECITK
jgi:hypothetical protein